MNQFNSHLDDLPLELFDMILQKSCLHSFLKIDKPENERDKIVIEKLASINFCCFKRVTHGRFKKAISTRLSLHYRNAFKRRSIIRNNQRYLLETIQPTDELLEKLQAEKCLTEDQFQSITKLRRDLDKNWEILHALRPYTDKICKIFVICLRQTGQRRVAKIIDSGGVVAKLTVSEASLIQRLIRKLNEYEDNCESKGNSLHTKMRIIEDDIELHLRDYGVVTWIWLKSRRIFTMLQCLIDSNSCKSNLMVEIGELNSSEVCQEVNIDDIILQIEFVSIHPIEIYFEAEFYLQSMHSVDGITKLKNKIYAMNISLDRSSSVIQVFEDRSPFSFLKKFEIKEIKYPRGLCSSDRFNCLYIADSEYKNDSIWMITEDEIAVRWVELNFSQVTSLSISFDGQLLAAGRRGHLSVFDSDKNFVLAIQTVDFVELHHAVETSNGNFVILYRSLNKLETFREKARDVWSWSLSELSRDQKTFIRHFVPQNESQMLTAMDDARVCIDSGGRIFVLDTLYDRVIMLDSDLIWMGILIEERKILPRLFRRIFFDEKSKQLILGASAAITVCQLL